MILLVASAATLCGGVVFMRGLLRERRLGEDSLSWPSTEGVVIACKYYPSTRGKSSTELSYQYSVDGTFRISDQTTVANHVIRGGAKEFAMAHPIGSRIPVYYDRSNPSTAILKPGIDPGNTVLLRLFGSILVFLAVSSIAYLFSFIRNLVTERTVRSHA
jgi:hypothetical protein